MKVTVDLEAGIMTVREDGRLREVTIGSPEGFDLASQIWLRAGWDAKHVYTFSWLGRPIIQLPEDMFRLQELIWSLRPDVIIETGVAHGGSLLFHAGLCKVIGSGRVIGVDVEIRAHNRAAIEAHELSSYVTLLEGSSTDPAVLASVEALVPPGASTLVLLDSNHTKSHVLAELAAYSPLVSEGSYIVVMDGIMEQLGGAERTAPEWAWDNPRQAALEFVASNPNFVIDPPAFRFNESRVSTPVTYWPDGFLRRIA